MMANRSNSLTAVAMNLPTKALKGSNELESVNQLYHEPVTQWRRRHKIMSNQNYRPSFTYPWPVHVTYFQGLSTKSYNLICSGLLVLTILLFPVLSQSVKPPGFVSINCGGKELQDPDTELEWEDDTLYLDSATELGLEGLAIHVNHTLEPEARAHIKDNVEQLNSAMVFIPGTTQTRTKFCYEYNTTSSGTTTFLIRATFPSSNLTTVDVDVNLKIYCSRFYFTVDSSFIATIELHPKRTKTIELLVNSIDENIYICLVPEEEKSSLAAISSLEIRPIDNTTYTTNFVNTGDSSKNIRALQSSYLVLIDRINFGGDPNLPSVRYPDDRFDRIWRSPEIIDSSEVESKSTAVVKGMVEDELWTPSRVLSTAWQGKTNKAKLQFTFNMSEARDDRAISSFYLNMLFHDVDPGARSAARIVDIKFDLHPATAASEITPELQDVAWATGNFTGPAQVLRLYNSKQSFTGGDIANFTIHRNRRSTLPAMINAVELYGEFEVIKGRTSSSDAKTIKGFSNKFPGNATLDRAGDPCLPVPWEWLVCSIQVPPRITQINVTNQGVDTEIETDFGQLDLLTILDLSDNNFKGKLPESVVNLTALRVLNLARNQLSGEVPAFPKDSLRNLESLSLANNQFNGTLTNFINALDAPISNLDLSSNQFSGTIPENITDLENLQHLNLANNQLSGDLNFNFSKLRALRTLFLTNNKLTGTVPDEIWAPDSNFTYLDMCVNEFDVLNLTTWFRSVRQDGMNYTGKQKVRLWGNKIKKVILPEDADGRNMEFFTRTPNFTEMQKKGSGELGELDPTSYILLAGNPYCDELELGGNNTLISSYLCRYTQLDDWTRLHSGKRGVDKSTVIIISVVTGFIVLLMATVLSVFLCSMWRRTRELRQIQEALAKDDVRPPWFKYEDLRTATRDFSTKNELGRGAFGTVYKAVQADGTTLAVKRLLPTEQNVADFLKEMVLISGIKHRHLIQLKGCCVREKERMLVYEFAENIDLAESLWGEQRSSVLDWATRFNICLGVARGLCYLHEELQPRIIHRDIKCQNILLDKDYNAKIADFGLARPAAETDATQLTFNIGGTRGYLSPEYATEGIISEKLDVYSYGVLLLEIVAGRHCIDLSKPPDQAYLRIWAQYLQKEEKLLNLLQEDLQGTCSSKQVLLVLETALRCLHVDPKNRPSMSQVVSMLMGGTDVASEIIKELQRTSTPSKRIDTTQMYNTLLEDTETMQDQSTVSDDENDDRSSLSSRSSPTNSSRTQLVQVPLMGR